MSFQLKILQKLLPETEHSCQATVTGVLKSQIAQSLYLTPEEKYSALSEQNSLASSSIKTTRMRSILVRITNICIL
jgi:hypothetical protein